MACQSAGLAVGRRWDKLVQMLLPLIEWHESPTTQKQNQKKKTKKRKRLKKFVKMEQSKSLGSISTEQNRALNLRMLHECSETFSGVALANLPYQKKLYIYM